jgi:L-seryl-tRNA(Ser) seleniumtransferase
MFSCDKLLGGPQAGIVAGKRDLISRLAKAPLTRALRVGKLTLAGLSRVCRNYLDEEKFLRLNSVLSMLTRKKEELKRLASKLQDKLKKRGVKSRIIESRGQCGGGSLPNVQFKSFAVEVLPPDEKKDKKVTFAERLYKGLLKKDKPVLGVLREGKIIFDIMTLFENDIEYIAGAIYEEVNNGYQVGAPTF